MQKLWSISLIKYSLSSVHEMTSRKSEMLLSSVLIDNCANLALHSMFSGNFSEFLANITVELINCFLFGSKDVF